MAKKPTDRPTNTEVKAAKSAADRASPPAMARAASKASTLIALLKREGGATLEEMMGATGWQKHSVRGFMAGTLKKQHGLVVSSEKTGTGRVYRLASEGQQ